MLNMAIGQGENSPDRRQHGAVLHGAGDRRSAARAGDRASGTPERERLFKLTPTQMDRAAPALAGVVEAGGTAAASAHQGRQLAGKTGTRAERAGRHRQGADHAWFVGFAPADNPKIVVAVMIEFGGHGTRAARIASAIIGHYLKVTRPSTLSTTDG